MPEIPPKLRAELRKLDKAVDKAKGNYEEASRKRLEAILEASETYSTHRIASAIGKSQSRIQQLIKGARAKDD